jgi:hypothetical protein
VCAFVVAGCDPPPVFDPAEDIFDLVALAVELLVRVVLDLAVLARRDARGGAALGQGGPEPVAVTAFVRQQFLCARQWYTFTRWIIARGGQSLFLAVVFHAMINVSYSLFPNQGSHYDPRVVASMLAVLSLLGSQIDTRFRSASERMR